MKKMPNHHPFYCDKKGCRKTAWETPEYLNEYDWDLLLKLTSALLLNEKELFDDILYKKVAQRSPSGETNDYIFFNRIIGWVEGKRYYRDMSSENRTYFEGMIKNDLPKLKLAVKSHFGH